jgi:hypothetical protein
MSKLLYLAAAVAVAVVLGGQFARADEPQQAPAKQSHAQSATTQAAQDHAAKDPNYRWHNGQWWYWMPQQKHWMVWNGSQWIPSTARNANRSTNRSFSYQEDAAPATTYSGGYYGGYRSGRWDAPADASVSNNDMINNSYGFRGAASKAIGKY